ncbi:MAG: DNA mismatch repair ATPase msh1 [Geoglossum simile]|nr:MAG: DNA mismatch repair ATPase msh1 [Geoglossum simile]
MTKFENCVLLTRVGSFYELYFEHADEFGPLLNLKVAQKKTNAGAVAMAGFPFYQLDRFLKILVQDLNRYVAISEEFPNDASARAKPGGLIFDRKVTRIITPGTLIDENFMDPYENNFLLGIHTENRALVHPKDGERQCLSTSETTRSPIGLAWLDLSTGDFFTQSTTLASLPSVIARIRPREIVLDENLRVSCYHDIVLMLQEERYLITYHPAPPEVSLVSAWSPMLEVPVSERLQADFTTEEVTAGSALLDYVKVRLLGTKVKLQPPIRRLAIENMGIDKNSMRALEIKLTIRDGVTKGSLFHAIRRTVTKSGARLLGNWLTSPLTSLSTINTRLDLVSQFVNGQDLRASVVRLLRRSHDTQRLIQKFSLGRGDPEDLIALSRTIESTQGISTILGGILKDGDALTSNCLEQLLHRLSLDGLTELANRISTAIDEEGLMRRQRLEESEAVNALATVQEVVDAQVDEDEKFGKCVSKGESGSNGGDVGFEDVWVMRKSASVVLRGLHNTLEGLGAEKSNLAEKLRTQLGHICHVRGKDIRTSLASLNHAKNVSSSKSTRSFHLPEWTQLGSRIDQTKLQIKAEEGRVFQSLREQVILNVVNLRRNTAVLDELDVVCSFAVLAQERNFVRPVLNLGSTHKIVGGRHPMVEAGLKEQGRSFVSNDCFIGGQERVWLITGPNMAGKSTFLRQNALITILAQIGSYVPAEYAEIGIVDQIFSRVGSADDLSRGRSTFMIEMLEAAEILKQATSRSFVIMDEVGRGTTPEDGIAVGYACLDHLYHTNKSRLLFATHFHALADMTNHFKQLGCYCTDVTEDAHGSFSYVHRLRRGINKQSHALKVARLAGRGFNYFNSRCALLVAIKTDGSIFQGLPESAIKTARDVLDTLRPPLKEDAGQKPSVSLSG